MRSCDQIVIWIAESETLEMLLSQDDLKLADVGTRMQLFNFLRLLFSLQDSSIMLQTVFYDFKTIYGCGNLGGAFVYQKLV